MSIRILDFFTEEELIALLDPIYLRLDCTNDPLTDDLELSSAGVNFLIITSTDHLVAGLRLKRSTWETDAFTDYSIYNNSGGDLLIDKLISSVTTNILMYDESITRWTFTGDVRTVSMVEGAIVRSDNYQNWTGDESFVWADVDDWWELSNDLKVIGNITTPQTVFAGTTGVGNVSVEAKADIVLHEGQRLYMDGS